ncbi:MAG: glycosyltransferase [Clostridia bacterium]|nr:glycosyltransferase [Clostridia bacterium]
MIFTEEIISTLMKVAIICDVLGEENNGTTIALKNLIEYLNDNGHQVKVVCPDKEKIGKEGYCVVPIMHFTPIISLILKRNGIKLAKPDKKILSSVIEWADVVHVEMPFALGRSAAKIAKKAGKPVTASFHMQAENLTAHLGLMNVPLVNKMVYKWAYSGLYRYADVVHYPTAFIKELFENSIKTNTNSVVISNGVKEAFFKNRSVYFPRVSEKFTILCAGRFSAEKAQQQLIKAVNLSKHKGEIKVVFAGSGPKEKKLKKLAQKCKIDSDFKFFSREELIAVQHAADLYVHTAVVEIEALCCIESIVSGLVPLICNSKRSATKNFALDERNLFKENDAVDLAKKIDYWYENPEDLKRYRELYKKTIPSFDQKKCMREMENMLKERVS